MGASIHNHLSGRERRKVRVRKHVSGTPERPRLSVFRSARHIYAQVIDDLAGHTLAAACSQTITAKPDDEAGKRGAAQEVGRQLAERCRQRAIEAVVFDRNGYRYHGRVRAVAEAAREAGLRF